MLHFRRGGLGGPRRRGDAGDGGGSPDENALFETLDRALRTLSSRRKRAESDRIRPLPTRNFAMVDDRPEDTPPLPDSGRPKRAPPTIDLEGHRGVRRPAARQSNADSRAEAGAGKPEPESEPTPRPPRAAAATPVSPWIVAVLSGAVAAALVIGVGWMLGWPAGSAGRPAAPQVNAAAIDGLAARIASVESKTSKPAAPAPDPAAAARVEALEKSIAALRGELAAARAQSDKLAAAVNDLKSAPGDSFAAAGSIRDQRAHRPDRTRQPRPERRDRAGKRQARGRCAAAPRRGGLHARRLGAARRALCRRAGGGEIADATMRRR